MNPMMISRKGENGVRTAAPVKAPSFNVAVNLIKNSTGARREAEEKEFNTASKKKIDEDLRDMMDFSKNTKAALQEINDAFQGDQKYDVIIDDITKRVKLKKKKRQITTDDRNATAQLKNLGLIEEEDVDE